MWALLHQSQGSKPRESKAGEAGGRGQRRPVENVLTPVAPASHVPMHAVSMEADPGKANGGGQPKPPAREGTITGGSSERHLRRYGRGGRGNRHRNEHEWIVVRPSEMQHPGLSRRPEQTDRSDRRSQPTRRQSEKPRYL